MKEAMVAFRINVMLCTRIRGFNGMQHSVPLEPVFHAGVFGLIET